MKTGLVLCGGGSLGSYEIGAWKKLREKGITFDVVTGSSIGAINGSMVVCDRFDDALKLWDEIKTDEVIKYGFDIDNEFWKNVSLKKGSRFRSLLAGYFKKHGVDNSPFEALMTRSLDPKAISSTKIPFGCVTVEYPSFNEVHFRIDGANPKLVIPYLMASSACFPVFPMYKMNGKSYIDGGWRNNMPIDYALELGADKVYAVLLHSFPPNPQKPFYYKDLPNVTLISPSRPQGSIMCFKKQTIENGLAIGYLDAGKAIGDYWGSSFTFQKNEETRLSAHKFYMNLLMEGPETYEKALRFLKSPSNGPDGEVNIYLANLERLGDLYHLDPYILYSSSDMEKEILNAIHASQSVKNMRVSDEKHYLLMKSKSERPLKKPKTKDIKQLLDVLFFDSIS